MDMFEELEDIKAVTIRLKIKVAVSEDEYETQTFDVDANWKIRDLLMLLPQGKGDLIYAFSLPPNANTTTASAQEEAKKEHTGDMVDITDPFGNVPISMIPLEDDDVVILYQGDEPLQGVHE